MKDFIVLLNKSEGITSAASLSCVKRNVNKKAGHTGTLDKFASGLLIALTGRYTKFTEKFFNLKQTYLEIHNYDLVFQPSDQKFQL